MMHSSDNHRTMRGPGPRPDSADDGPYVPEDLVMWVQDQIARGCSQVTLRQRADEGEMLVCNMPLPGDGAQALATAIYSRALSEGRFLRGPTLFVLYAFKELTREHCDRKSFRIEGETFPKSGETEPPTMQGVNSMLMRHAEGATKIALGHTSHIIEQYKVLLAQAHRRIGELEATVHDSSSTRESLLVLEHERMLSAHRAKIEEKQSDFLRDKLDLLFPILAGRVMGRNGAAVPTVVSDETLRQLFNSFTEEQMGQLAGLLRPEQQITIGELFIRYAQRSKDPNVAAAATEDGAATENGSPVKPASSMPPTGR